MIEYQGKSSKTHYTQLQSHNIVNVTYCKYTYISYLNINVQYLNIVKIGENRSDLMD